MVNASLNWASIVGIVLAVGGALLYFMRSFKPALARDYDVFFAAIGLLCGGILFFQGWRLDPILQFGQFLLAGTTVFFAYESVRLRGISAEQARRSAYFDDEPEAASPAGGLQGGYDDPYERFDEPDAAKEYIRIKNHPVVVKADGLAAGKGVILSHNVTEAYAAVDQIMIEEAFGDAGAEIVIEEFLKGEEASFFALCDGERAIPLAGAQDHKQVHDGDHGPNTGGMGAYTPAPVLDEAMEKRIMDEIVTPTVEAMKKEGKPYKGVLFAGLMIGEDGPKVIEFNCRFGDPECQPIMARLQSDALEMLLAAARGELGKIKLKWDPRTALTVVMAANGYPGNYRKGTEIKGLDDADALDDVIVFHAGTASDGNGRMLANGGRVLGVTALGDTVEAAQKRAYEAVDAIDWPQGFCRRDIGWRAVGR